MRLQANRLGSAVTAALAAATCGACLQPPQPPAPEEIFYSRNRVELLASLEPDARIITTLGFGTQAAVQDTHRSYVSIRTPDGLEGWVPRSMLLDQSERRTLRALTNATASLPEQGLFRTRDTLNVHLEPYRWSTTFYQLTAGQGVQVLDRMLVDRVPRPAPSATTLPDPTGLDYWYLVRITEVGQSGWLIGNMVFADVPIEVAAMAQGRPITAFFSLGSVADESLGTSKTTWLWLQSSGNDVTSDFDRLQVFQWDARRDRYIIVRQDSNLEGYLPVETLPDFESKHGTGTGFRILLRKDGKIHERSYVYANRRVYRLGEEPTPGVQRYSPPGGFGGKYSAPGGSAP